MCTCSRIRGLLNNASKKFKVEINCETILSKRLCNTIMRRNIVVVDGEAKELNKYKRLMMNRVRREEDIIKDRVGNDTPNKRVLV